MSQHRLLASYWSLIAGALCTDVRPKRIITYLFITFTFLYIIMQQIIFTCETVTPMFLAGADGSTPELRPPSIKGALRFWWRALNGHLSIEELKKQEGAIFGDTTQRSKVIIRVEETNIRTQLLQLNFDLKYMAYGAENRVCIDVGAKFKVILQILEKDLVLATQLKKELQQAFSMLMHLGGIGAKSRNGFGAFFSEEADSFDDVCQYKCFFEHAENSYTSLSENSNILLSKKSFTDWQRLVEFLKRVYQAGRKEVKKQNPDDLIFLAAPCHAQKETDEPARHAKLHLMSATKINGELRAIITYIPYNYLDKYGKDNLDIDDLFIRWEDTLIDTFNPEIESYEEKNKKGSAFFFPLEDN